ncbi:hypothetical protein J4526_00440 [Desulfurococcaceae archaeon MEX13E-LK6-19]|nr:hypothetical protein J4526_00440 [Desulfurococcaceae archaeon MEX13E-LK6-19]
MQSTRNSSTLEYLRKIIEVGERWAKEAKSKLVDFIKTRGGELVISYSSLGYSPASILYWLITTANPEKTPVLQDTDTIALYRLVYRKSSTVIVFTTRGDDPSLVRIADASRWTGGNILVVTPKPPDIVVEMLRNTPLITVPGGPNEILLSFYESLLSLYTGVDLGVSIGKRLERLKEFINEGYGVTVEELLEKYRNIINNVKEEEHIIITSTKFLEPASYILLSVLMEKNVKASFVPISLLKPKRNNVILIVSSSVEESLLKEKKMKALMSGAKVYELTFNVDPLELPIYLHILALSI